MRFHTRKWVKPEDLNPNGTLFGGKLLSWIDEESEKDAELSVDVYQTTDMIIVKSMIAGVRPEDVGSETPQRLTASRAVRPGEHLVSLGWNVLAVASPVPE